MLNKLLIAAGLLLSCIAGQYFTIDALNRPLNHGTLRGVSICLAQEANAVLSADSRKKACASQFEQDISYFVYEKIYGRGSIRKRGDQLAFEGALSNETSDSLVSHFKIEITFNQELGKAAIVRKAGVSGWFEPSTANVTFTSTEFEPPFEGWEKLKGCEPNVQVNCWVWEIDRYYGVSL